MISGDCGICLLDEAGDGNEAWRLIRDLNPDVAVLDIQMPAVDGVEVAVRIRRERLRAGVVLLTMHEAEEVFQRAMDAGVLGYLLKDDAAEDLIACIRAAAIGRPFITPSFSSCLLQRKGRAKALREEKPGLALLSSMERHILKMIAEDWTSKEIAEALEISPHTVENHRAHSCSKLGLHGSHRLLRFAFDHKSAL